MARLPTYPILVREGSVTTKIYRQKSRTTRDGIAYCVTWIGPRGRERKLYASIVHAREFAEMKAAQLANGLAEGHHLQRAQVLELTEARAILGDYPLLSALQEWKRARDLVGERVLTVCEEAANRKTNELSRITVADAVEKFIQAKNKLGKQGSRTYGSKLKRLTDSLGTLFLDSVTVHDWNRLLDSTDDAVTRNDIRKRAVSLCLWARRHGHLLENVTLEIEKTERAAEKPTDIGILSPAQYQAILEHVRTKYPDDLGAVVLAGFCGLRADEIQGKIHDREKRQLWEHIKLKDKELFVSAAKTNTPSWRSFELQPAALAWLKLCAKTSGPVGGDRCMERIRRDLLNDGFNLPTNCFRHSFITYRVAVTNNKQTTATEAGNSPREIDHRYRRPVSKAEGLAWFSIRP